VSLAKSVAANDTARIMYSRRYGFVLKRKEKKRNKLIYCTTVVTAAQCHHSTVVALSGQG
jgi:hypothetical protein